MLRVSSDNGVEFNSYLKNRFYCHSPRFSSYCPFVRVEEFIETKKLKDQNQSILNSAKNDQAILPGYFISKRYAPIYMDDYSFDHTHEYNVYASQYFGCQSIAKNESNTPNKLKRFNEIVANKLPVEQGFIRSQVEMELMDNVQLKEILIREIAAGTELLVGISTNVQDYKIIFRGSEEENFNHKLIQWLPDNIECQLLDILEFDHQPWIKDDLSYYYNIMKKDKYEYLLIGLYDTKQHKPIGKFL